MKGSARSTPFVSNDIESQREPKTKLITLRKTGRKYQSKLISLADLLFIISSIIILGVTWNRDCDISLTAFIIVFMFTCALQLGANIYKYVKKISNSNKSKYKYYIYFRYILRGVFALDTILSIYVTGASKTCVTESTSQFVTIILFEVCMLGVSILYLYKLAMMYINGDFSEKTESEKQRLEREEKEEEFRQSVVESDNSMCYKCQRMYESD